MALNLSKETILLVDDEQFSRATVSRHLEELGRPTVVPAGDGEKAKEIMISGHHDITMIISDFNMPEMHGLDLLKAVRAGDCGAKRAMPFAMLTGYSDKHLVDHALALDVNAFLVKPVSLGGLETRLTKMLRHMHASQWLKSIEEYQAMNVRAVLDEIMGFRDTSGEGFRGRGFFVMKKDEPLLRSEPDIEVLDDDAPRPDDAPPPEDAVGPDSNQEEPVVEAGSQAAGETQAGTAGDGGGETASGDGGGAKPPPKEIPCTLDNVEAGDIITRDIMTADGRLFLNAGQPLTDRVISILVDLHDLGHPVNEVWIEVKTPT